MLLADQIESPLGTIVLVARESRLVAIDFAGDDAPVESLARRLRTCAESGGARERMHAASNPFGLSSRLRAYFGGDLRALDGAEIDTAGTPFQRRVWTVLRRIPPGVTITYAELARSAGRPRAVRAAGGANACNRVAIAVPCHRVIGSDGSLTGYAGGLWRKRWLLHHEGALPGGRDLRHVSAPV